MNIITNFYNFSASYLTDTFNRQKIPPITVAVIVIASAAFLLLATSYGVFLWKRNIKRPYLKKFSYIPATSNDIPLTSKNILPITNYIPFTSKNIIPSSSKNFFIDSSKIKNLKQWEPLKAKLKKDHPVQKKLEWKVKNEQIKAFSFNVKTLVIQRTDPLTKVTFILNESGSIESASVTGKPVKFGQIKSWIKKGSLQKALSSPAEEPKSCEEGFQNGDFIAFCIALKQEKIKSQELFIEVENVLYNVWFKSEMNVICIQAYDDFQKKSDNKKLDLFIQNGILKKVQYENKDLPGKETIPNEFLSRIRAGFKKALEISSSYRVKGSYSEIKVKLIRRGIDECLAFHLNELSESIDKLTSTNLKISLSITFLTDSLKPSKGFDAGGLSKDYLNDLLISTVKNKQLSFEKMDTHLLLPKLKKRSLTSEEANIYKGLGKLFMLCFFSYQEYITGNFFDPALFKTVMSLTEKEINSDYDKLDITAKLRICRSLIEGIVQSGNDIKYHQEILKVLSNQSLTENELKCIAFRVHGGEIPVSLQTQGEADLQKIKQNEHSLIKELKEQILDAYECHLPPLHMIAKGMKSYGQNNSVYTPWDTFRKEFSPTAVERRIQGEFDRKQIVNAMKIGTTFKKKIQKIKFYDQINWIKEWIEDPKTSDEQVKKFLKAVTGSTALFAGQYIIINVQPLNLQVPYPKYHSCSNSFDLAMTPCGNDYYHNKDKKGFIRGFELSISDAKYSFF